MIFLWRRMFHARRGFTRVHCNNPHVRGIQRTYNRHRLPVAFRQPDSALSCWVGNYDWKRLTLQTSCRSILRGQHVFWVNAQSWNSWKLSNSQGLKAISALVVNKSRRRYYPLCEASKISLFGNFANCLTLAVEMFCPIDVKKRKDLNFDQLYPLLLCARVVVRNYGFEA